MSASQEPEEVIMSPDELAQLAETIQSFVRSSTQFLNRFTAACEQRLLSAQRALERLEVQTILLEDRLQPTRDALAAASPSPSKAARAPSPTPRITDKPVVVTNAASEEPTKRGGTAEPLVFDLGGVPPPMPERRPGPPPLTAPPPPPPQITGTSAAPLALPPPPPPSAMKGTTALMPPPPSWEPAPTPAPPPSSVPALPPPPPSLTSQGTSALTLMTGAGDAKPLALLPPPPPPFPSDVAPPGAAPLALAAPDMLRGVQPPPPPLPAGRVSNRTHPRLRGYFEMVALGVPLFAVKLKAKQDGYDPALLDAPEAPAPTSLLTSVPDFLDG